MKTQQTSIANIEAKAALQGVMIAELQSECLKKDAEMIAWRAKAEQMQSAIAHLCFDDPSDAYERSVRNDKSNPDMDKLQTMSTQLWWCREKLRGIINV
jgi:hypothetical protein